MDKLLSREYDKFTGMTEEMWHNEAEGTITFRRLQDVEFTLDMNKALRNESGKGFSDVTGGAYHKARIPFAIVEKWLRDGKIDWFNSTDKERRAVLNDPAHSKLLVKEGRM